MTFESTDPADVKQCDTEMVITSDSYTHSLDDGSTSTRTLPEYRYQFKTTVDPCIATLTNIEALETMVQTLGDAAISQPYQIDQDPACGYAETVTIEPSESWISVDTGAGTIDIA